MVVSEVTVGSGAFPVSFLGASSFCSDLAGALPSLASASAPERSSPSSPMMAMGVPTAIDLAPSFCYKGSANDRATRSEVVLTGRQSQAAVLTEGCTLTMILANTPSSWASTSIVALSVSISTKTSPAAKVSPSFFFHEAIPPSVMVGDMAGMWNWDKAEAGAEVRRPKRGHAGGGDA